MTGTDDTDTGDWCCPHCAGTEADQAVFGEGLVWLRCAQCGAPGLVSFEVLREWLDRPPGE